MTADQWIAAIVAILTGVAVRVIDRYWPELGKDKDTSSDPTPSSGSGEV